MKKYFKELKIRFFLILLVTLTISIVSYYYKEILLFLLTLPVCEKYNIIYFIFTDVMELFLIYFKLIYFLSLQVFFVSVIYHLYLFFIPALYMKEYSFINLSIKSMFSFWCISLICFNSFFIPLSWNFFYSFQEIISNKFIFLHFEAKLTNYLSFYISMYFIFVMYFQFFTLLFLVINYNNKYLKFIKKFRKLLYFFLIFFSTLITPPDIVSQIVLSFITIVIYELLIILLIFKNQLIR